MGHLDLWDYRRRVAALYDTVRDMGVGPESHRIWRKGRDDLFATHPQSPIEPGDEFDGLPYYPYDDAYQVNATYIAETEKKWGEFSRVGRVEFTVIGQDVSLPVFWLDAYGGGVFVPFGDTTNGSDTYGGGRYIIDTVKGADLGHTGPAVMLDFNFAYHPSCVHSVRWACPLAPSTSKLNLAVEAGERLRSPAP